MPPPPRERRLQPLVVSLPTLREVASPLVPALDIPGESEHAAMFEPGGGGGGGGLFAQRKNLLCKQCADEGPQRGGAGGVDSK